MDMICTTRRLHMRDKLSEREIARMTRLSRSTVSKWLRAPAAETPKYRLEARPNKLSAFETALKQSLDELLKREALRPETLRQDYRLDGAASGAARGGNFKVTGNPVLIDSSDAFVHAAAHSASCDVSGGERTPIAINRASAAILPSRALRVVVIKRPFAGRN